MTTRMPFRGARFAPAALACAWAGALVAGLGASLPATGADPDIAAPPVSWRQFHGRPTHQGSNPRETTVGANNVTNLSLRWISLGVTSDFGTVFRSSPAIAGGVASDRGPGQTRLVTPEFRLETWRVRGREKVMVRSLIALTAVKGSGEVATPGAAPVPLRPGSTVLVPRGAALAEITGQDLDLVACMPGA